MATNIFLLDDTELLDWAENHPEAAMEAVMAMWIQCGPGSREEMFNFRMAVRRAYDLFTLESSGGGAA